MAKAVKNKAELEGMQSSHLRDPAALSQFWAWLEKEIHENVVLTEVEVADKLLEFCAKQYGFLDTSFDTISAAAVVYRLGTWALKFLDFASPTPSSSPRSSIASSKALGISTPQISFFGQQLYIEV
ncbi:hypothetical protein IFM89_020276 [Coptis chinensis]|uniref:Uncharacterized protein n=1 Tax=Coptis chinensis TaxID=261450 RepID=A0A835I430_9MAGN|nr:hypothetical protein IFM89_020276 [Coptis chinensis]